MLTREHLFLAEISFLVIRADHIGCSTRIFHDQAEFDLKNILKVECLVHE
jgi:hypothetical protein